MEAILFIILFIVGALFINASHVPAWLLSGKKPKHQHWKTYGIMGLLIWILLLILVNIL